MKIKINIFEYFFATLVSIFTKFTSKSYILNVRTFASLLRAGYQPRNFTWLYRRNEEEPYIQFCRYKYGDAGKKTPIYKPYNRKCQPEILYIHPYFPDKPIIAVQIIKPFPFGKVKTVHYLDKGILTVTGMMKFSEVDIYKFPTFFKPIYEQY